MPLSSFENDRGPKQIQDVNAFKMMCGTKKELRYTNSRLYEYVRKDLRLSEEHKRKIGEAGKERRHTDETKLNMSLAQKGIPKTEEHKKNLRGKERSEEVRKAMSLARKGKPSPKKGLPGHKHSDEARKKMSFYNGNGINPICSWSAEIFQRCFLDNTLLCTQHDIMVLYKIGIRNIFHIDDGFYLIITW